MGRSVDWWCAHTDAAYLLVRWRSWRRRIQCRMKQGRELHNVCAEPPPEIRARTRSFSESPRTEERPHWASDEEYQTKVPRLRRRSLALAIAMACLALLGTAGAFGYREMFRGSVIATPTPIIRASNEPNKIALVSGETHAKNSGNARLDGADTTGSIEKLVSREEQPKTIQPKRASRSSSSPVGASVTATPAIAGQPVPDHAIPHVLAAADLPGSNLNGTGQSGAAGGTTGANRAHLATAAVSTAETSPPVLGDGYAVQVTSERSESAAQAAYRTLQAKYPNQLGGRQLIIRRADLGAAGTYYRALVGPFASAERAAKFCSGLKGAGGDCIVQKK